MRWLSGDSYSITFMVTRSVDAICTMKTFFVIFCLKQRGKFWEGCAAQLTPFEVVSAG